MDSVDLDEDQRRVFCQSCGLLHNFKKQTFMTHVLNNNNPPNLIEEEKSSLHKDELNLTKVYKIDIYINNYLLTYVKYLIINFTCYLHNVTVSQSHTLQAYNACHYHISCRNIILVLYKMLFRYHKSMTWGWNTVDLGGIGYFGAKIIGE